MYTHYTNEVWPFVDISDLDHKRADGEQVASIIHAHGEFVRVLCLVVELCVSCQANLTSSQVDFKRIVRRLLPEEVLERLVLVWISRVRQQGEIGRAQRLNSSH